MTRRRKLYLNTATAFINEIIALICGFILPRYILLYFGSDVNGIVNSITRFLSIISFLELGVGPVIQSNLYKPLAEKDNDSLSKIVASSEKFYRRIAYIFLMYIAVLVFAYPSFNKEFDFWFTASLVIIISISTFAQYYFGITYQVFLNADQKVYVQTTVQMITTILNTAICVGLILAGLNIHMVKLASAAVYVIRPIFLNIYVKRHYQLNLKIQYTGEPIKQKWNGFAQHLAAVVSQEIDVVLLTLFSSYQNVSIYSVYLLVASGLNKMVMSTVSGLESFWGNMIAKNEKELLSKTFDSVECLMHMGVTFLFVTAAILITPFVTVYTYGIEDSAAYYVPVFGILLSLAYGCQCLRVPYFRMIKAAGHYKETQVGAFISMGLNIVVSVVLVIKLQLVGVAIGTVVAMMYHTIYFAWYLRRNIIDRPFKHFVWHMIIDILVGVLAFFLTMNFQLRAVTYQSWVVLAVKVALVVGVISLVNVLIYRKQFTYFFKMIMKKA